MTGSGLGLLNDCDVKEIIKRRTGKDNLFIKSWCLEAISDGGGFMGSYYRLNIIVNFNGQQKTFNFFAKTPPPPGPQRDFSLHYGIYNKEIVMYNEIVPQMGIGSDAKWSPDCYYCKTDIIIVMENLILNGYCTLDKYLPFGYEEMECLIKTFAKFHSRSLIYDEKLRLNGKNIQDIWGDVLNEGLISQSEPSMLMKKSSLFGTSALVDLIDSLNNEQKEIVKKKITKWTLNLVDALKPSKKYRNIICHRDVWSGNFMFKLNDSGKKIDCRLIDFQFVSYIYPAIDIIFAIYLNTTRAIRDKYLNSLIELYYNCLGKYLKNDGNLNIENILPWNLFLESCETARPSALVYVIWSHQITLLPDDICHKYFTKSTELLQHVFYGKGRPELVCPPFLNTPQYRERITESIIELYECLPDKLFNEDDNK